jgi:site-specific recombinase XerD
MSVLYIQSRRLHPDEIDRILRKYARGIGLERGYSAHSIRGTFTTTALDNGLSLEDVQWAAGRAEVDIAFTSAAKREVLSIRCYRRLAHEARFHR